jgi:hypothetical protein
MPANTPCAKYLEEFPKWKRNRDCLDGEDAIKIGGEAYLPKPSGDSPHDYKRYITRAHFFGATGRTADGLHGGIFSKDPQQAGETPLAFAAMLQDVDHSGTPIDQFASDITWDALPTNWGGILVDYTKTPDDISKADAERIKSGAYLQWYAAENIINWRYKSVNGARQLTLVSLYEPLETPLVDDLFVTQTVNQYRVLSLDENGIYVQQVFQKDVEAFKIVEEIIPLFNGAPLDFIPFFLCPGKEPEKSMLNDLVIENIGHYQKTADYEEGLHFTSIATPVITGVDHPVDPNTGQKIDIPIGGTKILFLNSKSGTSVDAKYMEFSGTGMTQLREALNSCESRMAILGARIISAEKKGIESAETARIHRAGENSVLAAFARNMSEKITSAVRLMAEWNGVPKEQCSGWSYALNTDYDMLRANAAQLNIVLQAVEGGQLPRVALYNAAKDSELIPETMSFEQFVEEINNDTAAIPVSAEDETEELDDGEADELSDEDDKNAK